MLSSPQDKNFFERVFEPVSVSVLELTGLFSNSLRYNTAS